MVAEGLITDVEKSRYVQRSACFDSNGVETAASARIGQRGGEICFNIPMLVRLGGTERDLISLTLHEHSHQLGTTSESDAVADGESLATYLADRMVLTPPPGTDPLPQIPSDGPDSRGCLNFHRALARFRSMPETTQSWIAQIDRRLPASGIEPWARQYWSTASSFIMARQDTLRNVLGSTSWYQEDCTSIVLPTGPGSTTPPRVYRITEASAFHLVALPVDAHAEELNRRIEIRMPEGAFGNRFHAILTKFEAVTLRCGTSETPSYSERTDTYRAEVDSILPEYVPISNRMLKLLDESRSTSRIPAGCYVFW